MNTAHQLRVKRAILASLKPSERKVAKFKHIYPSAYVALRSAVGSLSLAAPGFDAMLPEEIRRPGPQCYRFSGNPRTGDWVSIAYVVLPNASEFVAVGYVP